MSDDRFRVLFDHASDAHLIFDETGITDCNDATIELLGASGREEVLALHPARLSPPYQPDGRASAEKSLEMDALAVERGWHRFEWLHQRIDGTPIPVEVTLNAVTIDGRPAMVAVWHDLTERKRREAELQRLTEETHAANERMRRELEAAAEVQQGLLPQAMPEVTGASFAWRYRPCDELGGDILNVYRLDDEHVGFYLLDVTGHGVAASLLSVAISHVLSPYAEGSYLRPRRRRASGERAAADPAVVAERLNDHFAWRGGTLQFFTLFQGILAPTTGELRYVSAGHPPPLIRHAGGDVEALEGGDVPIGVMPDASFTTREHRLAPGDRLVVYSDGIPEARDVGGRMLGTERVAALVGGEAGAAGLEGLLDALLERALDWTSPRRPDDDISLLGLALEEEPSA